MKRSALIMAFIMVLSSGLVHALWSQGGERTEALAEALERVKLVPLNIGAWHGKDIAVDEEEFAQAGAEAYWMRQYSRRGRSITVLLMCGRAGRMSVHTPEFCYQGLGYQMVSAAANVEVPTGEGNTQGSFWTARFTKQLGAAGGDLRLLWAWNAGDGWKAPASPRWEFRGKPFLYKLYVVHETSPGRRLEYEPGFEFLKDALPELERILSRPTPLVGVERRVGDYEPASGWRLFWLRTGNHPGERGGVEAT